MSTPDTFRDAQLFLAVQIPGDFMPGEHDPDAIADAIVDMLNDKRMRERAAREMLDGSFDVENGVTRPEPFIVGGIPSPQWLTPNTLNRLRGRVLDDPSPDSPADHTADQLARDFPKAFSPADKPCETCGGSRPLRLGLAMENAAATIACPSCRGGEPTCAPS